MTTMMIQPTDAEQAFYDELRELVEKHALDVSPWVMTAIMAQCIGGFIAFDDTTPPNQWMHMFMQNMSHANQNAMKFRTRKNAN